jgi:vitamin B12/bleomycin/antimicrobial peptide transport system ATP-binding/permease protein
VRDRVLMPRSIDLAVPHKPHRAGSPAGFLRFALGFWTVRDAQRAWYIAGAILLLLLANLVVNVGLNRWNRWFFDMLERREAEFLPLAVASLAGLIVSGAGFAVAMVKSRMTLQVMWRQWVTDALIETWFGKTRDSPIFTEENHGSPAFRIAEDLRLALAGC